MDSAVYRQRRITKKCHENIFYSEALNNADEIYLGIEQNA